ncbi:DUF523 domain-containing protein [Enterocloster clostridioformis]|uniref:DUF523 domain-containing protein n=1 Tax=Enterocloster clostridioformis TaxID=1531 RepID=UPI00080C9626|nr:DUF523 domain-containing protein [Enterocloster clostridioformis]ANU47264.1 hypothetical protein A4V08_17050 [Lachnoclostridium sp. YL32]NDO31022.1 DUF523 domain-containing protein [Enterocloster clostridioformis]OXE66456.1 DUF523 domain-containing protein [Enterocloster clostridioformis]QQR03758.1 DUF523 domain-containing protein [Enterocloster clostridioformis]
MKVLVSSCVLGRNCKYDGGNNYNSKIMDFLKDKEIVEICPELLADLPIPRPSAELVDGVVMSIDGENVDKEYRHAVELAMREIGNVDIDLVILQSRSPTCGVNQIYDGSFTGRLIKGQGLFAQALIKAGYKVVDAEDF